MIRLTKDQPKDGSRFLGIWTGDPSEARERFKKMRKDFSKDFEYRQDVLFRHEQDN
jgi:hypothetical protein